MTDVPSLYRDVVFSDDPLLMVDALIEVNEKVLDDVQERLCFLVRLRHSLVDGDKPVVGR